MYVGFLKHCLFVYLCLGHCNHKMVDFQKIYSLYYKGLKRHRVEKRKGGCHNPDTHTDGRTVKIEIIFF